MYSYHNFLFPFRFDKVGKFEGDDRHEFYKKIKFDERVKIDKYFRKELDKNGWEYKKFEINNNLDYNEFVYFHDFVKDSLFNLKDFDRGATSYFFKKRDIKNNFTIKLTNQIYILDLKSITLRIFDTGIGILSIEVENNKYCKFEDILKINEFGRRIYPQFVSNGFDLGATRNAFLPTEIKIDKYSEDFSQFFCDIKNTPFVKIGSHILDILGDTFSQKLEKDKYLIQPILDDRMFMISWYGDNEKIKSINKNCILKDDDLYKYIFIDGGDITVQDESMKKEFMKKSLYTRWKGYNTLYGMTRYSFVCISERSEYTQNVLPLPHMKTMYYQMMILVLALRASILRFSDEVTAISDIDKNDNPSDNVENLYKNYLRFKNKLYFKEITAQEQGIEIYDKIREIMRIDNDIADLSQEITSLNSFAFFLDEKEEKKEMNKLTKVATIFMPPTLVAGFFGMNVFPDKYFDKDWIYYSLIFMIISIFVTFGIIKLLDFFKNDSK